MHVPTHPAVDVGTAVGGDARVDGGTTGGGYARVDVGTAVGGDARVVDFKSVVAVGAV